MSPVFVSQKIERDLKMREAQPPLVNQQCLVYKCECDLGDAGYVGYTSARHVHQRIEEHKSASSSIGQHFRVKHSSAPKDLSNNFSILKKNGGTISATPFIDDAVQSVIMFEQMKDFIHLGYSWSFPHMVHL